MALYDKEYENFNLTANGGESPKNISEIELTLQISSYAHEYTRLEFEGTGSSFQKQALLEKLEAYQEAYFSARRYLMIHYPERLEKLESELAHQKRELFPVFSA